MNNENTFSGIVNKVDKEFIDSFKTDCEKCLHKPVCKEIENWKIYCEEHIRLREKSILFDSQPRCPYYLEQKKSGLFDNMKSPKEPKYGIRNIEFEDGRKSIPCNELTKDKTDNIYISTPRMIEYNNKEDKILNIDVEKLRKDAGKRADIPIEIKFDNGSEIKTILCDGNVRGKRAELPILYFDYEKCPEGLFEEVIITLFKK